MTRPITVKASLILGVGILALVVAGCPDNPFIPTKTGESKLIAFNSASDLLSYFRTQATARTRASRNFGFQNFAPTAAGGFAEDAANSGDGASDSTYSTTNLQEAGVDESDVFKSDGTYFYIARGDRLSIVKATPVSEMEEVGSLTLDVHAREMFLRGSKLILLAQRFDSPGGQWAEPGFAFEIWPPYYVASELIVVEIDISDPTAPVETKRVELDGTLVSSRLTNNRLIAVLTVAPELPEQPTALSIGLMTLDDVIPEMRTDAGAGDMVPWEGFLYPESPDGYFMTAVVTLDADDIETIIESVAVIGDAGTIYASTEALYVTDSQYDESDTFRETTAIHKFAYDNNGAAQYTASGVVPGRLLNQFSLGEYEGKLRVATHVDNFQFFGFGGDVAVAVANAPPATSQGADDATQQSSEPQMTDYNAVYVLEQSGGDMPVIGSVEDIAPTEQLHSARFLGERGFVVTFKRIDPLFVLDLTDPTDPQVVGELEVPGFSDYLHPVDDTHLIGIGKFSSPTTEGFDWVQGVQISLFDVSDWTNPTAVEQVVFGGRGSWSAVDHTHKAFTYVPATGQLAIPMQLHTPKTTPWEYGEMYFDGVVCLQVDLESGFTEMGRVDAISDGTHPGFYFGGEGWRRSAFIGDTVYAISDDGVAAVPMTDFEDVTALELPSE